jgi:hypothetical protein
VLKATVFLFTRRKTMPYGGSSGNLEAGISSYSWSRKCGIKIGNGSIEVKDARQVRLEAATEPGSSHKGDSPTRYVTTTLFGTSEQAAEF